MLPSGMALLLFSIGHRMSSAWLFLAIYVDVL